MLKVKPKRILAILQLLPIKRLQRWAVKVEADSIGFISDLDLYNFTKTVAIRVNGEKIYQGIFRSSVMSAVPSLPKIAILYPSIDYDSGVENNHAIRLFYPSFEAPSSLTEMNTKFTQYFQDAGKLVSKQALAD